MKPPSELAIVKSEILTDPRGYGYANRSDFDILSMLSLLRTGVAGNVTLPSGTIVAMVPTNATAAGGVAGGLVSVRRNDITGAEILQVIDLSQQAANATVVDAAVLNACGSMRQISFVDPTGTDYPIFKSLKQIFGAGTTRTAISALSKRTGSRLEELLVAGTAWLEGDVRDALNS